jgi:glycosyltransferase involved in cell wall biosynthesis
MGLYNKVKFHATNEEEANHVKLILGTQHHVHIAPNLPRAAFANNSKKIKSKPTTFVNVARISTEKGTLKMIDALHSIKSEMVLHMYGPIYDAAYWELCQKSIERLPAHIKVSYKGIIPSEDVPTILQQYDFFVLLSEGENFGHAILEALMAGCPVIISDQTPWKQLETKGVGWDVDVSDSIVVHSVFDKASRMTNEEYQAYSNNAIQLSKEFSENPELLILNLQLFN